MKKWAYCIQTELSEESVVQRFNEATPFQYFSKISNSLVVMNYIVPLIFTQPKIICHPWRMLVRTFSLSGKSTTEIANFIQSIRLVLFISNATKCDKMANWTKNLFWKAENVKEFESNHMYLVQFNLHILSIAKPSTTLQNVNKLKKYFCSKLNMLSNALNLILFFLSMQNFNQHWLWRKKHKLIFGAYNLEKQF